MFKKLLKYKKTSLLLFYIAIAIYFTYLQWGAGFADPDSFYHAKMGEFISKGILTLQQFPWFTFTTFSGQFTDHQFLYHILIAPAMSILSPLVAAKAMAIIFAVIFFIVFERILKTEKVQYRIIFLLLLLSVSIFIFRLNLAKAGAPALILLFAGLHALWHKKYKLLFISTFLYVWTHAGWMSMGVVYVSWFITNLLIQNISETKKDIRTLSKKIVHEFFYDKAFLAILGGMVAGVIINPYFPNNLLFYWQQAIQIGLVNYQSEIRVGMEWYPFSIEELGKELAGIWIMLGTGLSLFIARCLTGAQPTFNNRMLTICKKLLHSTMLMGMWFALTLKSARYVEYLAPFALLTVVFLFEILREMGGTFFLKEHITAHKKMYTIIASAFLAFYLITNIQDTFIIQENLTSSFPWIQFKESSKYLSEHTPSNSLVFHTNWSDAPLLFFHNNHNRYMAGLDPTFFYLLDPTLYRKWVDIGQGSIHESAKTIFDTFKTNFILISLPQDWNLNYILKKEPRVKALFHDDSSIIYQYNP